MNDRLPAICLLAVLTLACTSRKPRGDFESPGPFSESFEILETRQGARRTAPPASTLIDYESNITIRPDRVALARLISIDGAADRNLTRSEVAELDARIDAARSRLRSLDDIGTIAQAIEDYEAESISYFERLADGRIAAGDETYDELLTKRKAIIDALDRITRFYVEIVVLKRTIGWDASPPPTFDSEEGQALFEANQEHDRVYEQLAPSVNGGRNRYVASEVTRVLNETASALRGEIGAVELAILAKAPKAELELEAAVVRGRGESPITIAPYSIVENQSRGGKTPRIGIPSEDDIARVKEGYDAYDDVADAFNDLKDAVEDDDALRKLRATFVKELKGAAERLAEGLIEDLKKAARLEGPEFEPIRTPAGALRTELERLTNEVESLDESEDPIAFAASVASILDQLRSGEVTDQVEALATALASFDVVAEGAAKELIERLRSSVEDEASSLVAALEGAPGGAELAELFRSLSAVSDIANAQSFGDLETGKITRRPFTLDVAQDGTIDLADSRADDGDRLVVRYELTVAPDAEPDLQMQYRGSSWLDVRKFGLYTTFEAQLLFYDRLNDGNSSYRAAPGIAYNFHYRPESQQGFFDAVSPGIGINVSSPSFEEGADLAIGLQLTLFDDLIQAGYAYNISVSDDPEMFFFGLDLIGTFRMTQ